MAVAELGESTVREAVLVCDLDHGTGPDLLVEFFACEDVGRHVRILRRALE
jgi:hypothetical protein